MELMNPVEVGDKVLVRADIGNGIDHFHVGITSGMLAKAGKIVTVKWVRDKPRNGGYDENDNPLPYNVHSFQVEGMSELWTSNLIIPLDSEKAFDALVRGQIDDKTYKQVTEETL